MTEKENVVKNKERSYPAVYEKVIPIAIGLIVISIIVMLVLAAGIATGVLPSG